MKKLLNLFLLFTLFTALAQSQSLQELETTKADLEAAKAELQDEVDTYNGYQAEIDALNTQIEQLLGWQKGFSGVIGFDFNKSNLRSLFTIIK